jgi:hypothetical protein
MCRNIRTLHNFEPRASDEEVRAAALQYVRKISGFTKPSQANAHAFEHAVEAVASISAQLLDELVTTARSRPPRPALAPRSATPPERPKAARRQPSHPSGRGDLKKVLSRYIVYLLR